MINDSPFLDVRLTGFRYSPSDGALSVEDKRRLVRVLADEVSPAQFMALRAGTERDRHAAGVLRIVDCVLATGDGAKDCEAGVEILAEVVEARPDDLGLRNDLAAARLLTASRSGRIEQKLAALEDVTRVVELDPRSAEATYNLARIQEDLSLWRQAGAGYARYLEHDRESEWGKESAIRQAALAGLDPSGTAERVRDELERAVERADTEEIERLVQLHPQLVRELAQDELLIRWAREMEGPGESSISNGLSLVGSALIAASHDYTVADTLAAMLPAPRGNGMLRRLSAYGQALPLLNDLAYESARPLLLAAGASTEPPPPTENPLQRWAGYYLALEAYQKSDYETAFAATERLARSPGAERYPALQARLFRVQALMYRIRGDYPRARERYLEAAGLSQSSGELGAYADHQVSLVHVLHALGDRRAAWRTLDETLRLRGEISNPVGQYRLLNAAAIMLRDEIRPSAARWFQAEAIELTGESENPTLLVEAYRELAAIEEAAGNVEEALEALENSSEHAASVSSPAVGRFLDLENHRRAGLILASIDPYAAVLRLSRAIENGERIGYGQVLPSLHLARADVYHRMGREAAIEADLRQAIRQVESQSSQIRLPEYRLSFSDQTRAVYERMVLFQWDQGNRAQAFVVADRPRNRLILDWLLDRGEAHPEDLERVASVGLTAERVVAVLDDRSVLVEFGLFGNRTLAWVFTAYAGMRTHELSSSPEDLRVIVRRLHDAAENSDFKSADRELAILYQVLIEPLGVDSSDLSQLIVVPHDELDRVPFSSLIDGQGHRLLHTLAVVISPSAAATVAASAASRTERRPSTALVVGDPQFDQQAHPELPPLENSLLEATEVARVYGYSSRLLTGPRATRAAFLEGAPAFDVIHIASHASEAVEDPLGASIIMAASPGQPSTLTARDILELDLRGVRLVVLSTCGSAAAPMEGGASVQSLARAFISAGAQAVVASVWRIDDAEIGRLAAQLHMEVLSRSNTTEAVWAWKQDLDGSAYSELSASSALEIYAPR